MRISTLCLSLLLAVMLVSQASAQGFFRDFVINNPRQYGPDDPWTTGKIFYTRIGHGGLFYNCDYEECKRYSPYIEWNRQSTCYHRKAPVANELFRQLFEIRQRVRWGACCDGEYCDGCAHCSGGGGHYAKNAEAPLVNGEAVTEATLALDATPMLETPPVAETQQQATIDAPEGYSHGGVKVMKAEPPQAPEVPAMRQFSRAVDSQQGQPARTSNRDQKFRMLR